MIGAVFDWDGVIVDSSVYHRKSWEDLGIEEGLELPRDHFERGFGRKNEVIIPHILGWTSDPSEIRRMSLRKEALYRDAMRREGLEPLPGVRELLATLAENAIPCAVGSSTHRENIDLALELLGLGGSFEVIVTAEDVTDGKPDPQVFLVAGQRLGIEPPRCIVFEDVPAGIQAGHNAGMTVVAVATTHPARILAEADLVVQDLSEVSLVRLKSLVEHALAQPAVECPQP